MKLTELTKEELTELIRTCDSRSEVFSILGLTKSGSHYRQLNALIENFVIDISHFGSKNRKKRKIPLKDILIEGSTYYTTDLKKRLYREGLKERVCELCGLGEIWKGKKMSLILDHINGVNNDHRLDNLRIVCPNCNATLDTHCGKNKIKNIRFCWVCKSPLKTSQKKYCSRKCMGIANKGKPILSLRKVERPSFEILKKEIDDLGYVGTGKKYGVSDNAIRKWEKFYATVAHRESVVLTSRDRVGSIPTSGTEE